MRFASGKPAQIPASDAEWAPTEALLVGLVDLISWQRRLR